MRAQELTIGDTIIIDGHTRIIRDIRRLHGDVGLTFFYEGPHIGNLAKNNSESYLNFLGFTVVERAEVAA
jgi:hypothetical protein